MADHPSPKISCILCGKPVNLSADLIADEKGRIVHEQCYVNRVVLHKWAPFLSSQTSA